MASSLNDGIILEFMQNTGLDDPVIASSFLQSCQWDLQSATSLFLDGDNDNDFVSPLAFISSASSLSNNTEVAAIPKSGSAVATLPIDSKLAVSSFPSPSPSPSRSALHAAVEKYLNDTGVQGASAISEELLKRCSSFDNAVNTYFDSKTFYDSMYTASSVPISGSVIVGGGGSTLKAAQISELSIDEDEALARALQFGDFQNYLPPAQEPKQHISPAKHHKSSLNTASPPLPPPSNTTNTHNTTSTGTGIVAAPLNSTKSNIIKPTVVVVAAASSTNSNIYRCHLNSDVCVCKQSTGLLLDAANFLKLADVNYNDIDGNGLPMKSKRQYYYCDPCMSQYLQNQRRLRDTYFSELPMPLPSHDWYNNCPLTTMSLFLKPKKYEGPEQLQLISQIICPFRCESRGSGRGSSGGVANNFLDERIIFDSPIYLQDYEALQLEFERYNRIKPNIKCHFADVMACQSPDYRFADNTTYLGCDHYFHTECLGIWLKNEIEHKQGTINAPFCPECVKVKGKCKCPSCLVVDARNIKLEDLEGHKFTEDEIVRCLATVPDFSAEQIGSYWQKYDDIIKRRFLKYIHEPGFTWFMCSCERDGASVPNYATTFDCGACKKKKCVKCKEDFHGTSISCNDAEIKRIRDLAEASGEVLRECPRANICKRIYGVPLNCKHSTCVDEACKFEFCYNCGAEYNSTIAHDGSYHYLGCHYYQDCCELKCSAQEVDALTGVLGGKTTTYAAYIGLGGMATQSNSSLNKARKSCCNPDIKKRTVYKPGPCTACFEQPGKHNTCTHNPSFKCWSASSCAPKHNTPGYFCRHYCFQCHFLGKLCQPMKIPANGKIIEEDSILKISKPSRSSSSGGGNP